MTVRDMILAILSEQLLYFTEKNKTPFSARLSSLYATKIDLLIYRSSIDRIVSLLCRWVHAFLLVFTIRNFLGGLYEI